jgi:hypothetical protein
VTPAKDSPATANAKPIYPSSHGERQPMKSYHLKGKRKNSDSYGSWENGRQIRADRINGRTLTYNHITGEWK